jgi:hypothetical protein
MRKEAFLALGACVSALLWMSIVPGRSGAG